MVGMGLWSFYILSTIKAVVSIIITEFSKKFTSKNVSKRRGLPEINFSDQWADITFLLLIFFLVTTTMDVDSGISRKLPFMPEENIETPEIHKRNIFVVLINKNNKVLAGIGSPTNNIEIDGNGIINESLKEDVKAFVSNNGKKDNSSESPEKAVVSLQNQEGTSYSMYIQVQNEPLKPIMS